jgi:ATP-binding cassette subfamily C protein
MGMLDGAGRLVCRHADEARGLQEIALRRTDIIQAFAKSTRSVSQVLMMGTAAWLVLEEQRSPGIIFVSSLLFARGITPLEGAIGAWKAFAWARGAYRRLTDMLVAVAPGPASEPIPLPQPRGGVFVADAGFTQPATGRLALRGISLQLAPGDCLGVIGPSGSGKSTLGRLIAGIAAPSTGNILLDGIDISTWRRSGGCRHIGYLPQDIELFGGAVKHIIGRWNGDLRDVIKAAALAGLHETIMKLPQGYDTDIGDGTGHLLRGQRQRLGLARAVFGDPRLVVLDEPNASLDYSGEHMLFEAIERMKAAGITVVIITHRTGILAATNKIAILQDGALSAFGDRDAIFERHLQKPRITQRDAHAPPARPGGPSEDRRDPAPSVPAKQRSRRRRQPAGEIEERT